MPTNNYRELKKESIKKTSLDLNDALLNTLNIRIIFLNELSIKYSCKPNSVNPRGNLFTSLLTVSRIISLYTYTYTSTKCTHVRCQKIRCFTSWKMMWRTGAYILFTHHPYSRKHVCVIYESCSTSPFIHTELFSHKIALHTRQPHDLHLSVSGHRNPSIEPVLNPNLSLLSLFTFFFCSAILSFHGNGSPCSRQFGKKTDNGNRQVRENCLVEILVGNPRFGCRFAMKFGFEARKWQRKKGSRRRRGEGGEATPWSLLSSWPRKVPSREPRSSCVFLLSIIPTLLIERM